MKTRLIWVGLFLCSAAMAIFTVVGVYDVFWNVPEKRAAIAELTENRDTWKKRAKELDRYIVEREKEFQVAHKFENIFLMCADPDQVMDFEKLEDYIKNKKEFFKPVEK